MLDPNDWSTFRKNAHELLDAAIDKMENNRSERVWTSTPTNIRELFSNSSTSLIGAPINSISIENVAKILKDILPYGVGNTHPRFFGWVHGSGSISSLLAEIICSSMNVNSGGRDTISPIIEKEVISWMIHHFQFPQDISSGIIVSGTSMATIIALKIAKDSIIIKNKNLFKDANNYTKFVGYCSEQGHSCIKRAFDLLGFDKNALRMISCNSDFTINTQKLDQTIQNDINNNFIPFIIVGTVGSVNVGSIDSLIILKEISLKYNCWFHIDGAFGGSLIFSNSYKYKINGIENADSIAFDFHKWIHINYDAGFILIRDSIKHRNSFSARPEYLRSLDHGIAGGDFWGVDYGPELSRSFRALKVWTHFKLHGTKLIGDSIDMNIDLAQYLYQLITKDSKYCNILESLAPVTLQINVFRYIGNNNNNFMLDKLNEKIIIECQNSGIAVPSSTNINGKVAIRVNITNHRTTREDLDLFIATIIELGKKFENMDFIK